MGKKKIVAIPKRDSPRVLARKYMEGTLPLKAYENKHGGIFRLMQMADNTKAVGAAEKALKQLRELSGIDRDVDTQQNIDLKLVDIENRDGKIVEMHA